MRYIASLATVAKHSLGMFNSAQCIHELLSMLTLVRINLAIGFQNILVVNDSWHLVIIVTASSITQSIE